MNYFFSFRILACLTVFVVVFCAGCEPQTLAQLEPESIKPQAQLEAEPPVFAEAEPEEAVEAQPPVEAGPEEVAEPQPPVETEPAEIVEAPRPAEPEAAETKPDVTIEKVVGNVLVTVNGVGITEEQIQEMIKPQLAKMAQQSAKLPPALVEQYKNQLRQQAMQSMIEVQLLDEKVKEEKIEITDEEINARIEQMASQQKLSVEDLKALIEAYGQNFEEWKQRMRFRERLGYQKLFETKFGDEINFTEEDAQNYYSEHKAEFEVPEQIRASHILIKLDTTDINVNPDDAKTTAKAKTQELLKQIRDGADFATLAIANSTCPSASAGGDLKFFARGQMVPPFDKAAFELKVGQVSDIVETQYGYHIIKVTDHKDANVITFEQAKENIMNTLLAKKRDEIAIRYVESLKSEANIVYRDPALQPAPPAGREPATVPGQ